MRFAALALAAAAALGGCKSSAKYTVPAAAINTGLAVGLSAVTRAQGGCYAVCSHGTVCNPKTGYCEGGPTPGQFCEEAPGGGVRCAALAIDLGAATVKPPPPAGLKPAPAFGISPATGAAPPPPAESSPRSGP